MTERCQWQMKRRRERESNNMNACYLIAQNGDNREDILDNMGSEELAEKENIAALKK